MNIEKHKHTDKASTLKFLKRARKENKGRWYGLQIEADNGLHSIKVYDTSIQVQNTPFGNHGGTWDMSVKDLYDTIMTPLDIQL